MKPLITTVMDLNAALGGRALTVDHLKLLAAKFKVRADTFMSEQKKPRTCGRTDRREDRGGWRRGRERVRKREGRRHCGFRQPSFIDARRS